jgi:cell division septation protein DedD
MTDWSIIGTQQVQGPTDTRATLGMGGIIAGGEADVLLNYSTSEPFIERQQQYLWRFANNDNTILKQAIAGKINSQATSTIYDPVVGVQFTNTPTTYRRSFGSYSLADYTKPDWTVELYVNNVLVNYTKADASGFYRFDVPLVYGNTEVKLRFYGPYGEETSSQKIINIPFNFLPAKDLEYTVSGGIVEDSVSSRYARATLNYGLNKRLTIGGGVEYLSSVTSGNTMPFVNFSLRIASSLLITSEYTYGVRWKSILSYRLPSNFQIDLNYIKYVPGQTAINYNYLEERKAILSYPIIAKNFSSYFRLTIDQIILPISQYTTAEFLFSGGFFGINTNLTTYALFFSSGTPNVYSNLSLGFRLPKGFTLTPQIQYNYNLSQLISVKCELEKRIFKNGAVNATYERNVPSNINSTQIGFRYDFAFARTGVLVRQSNNSTTLVESAQGGLILDAKTKYFSANNNNNVGRGGIVLVPFLDYNGNGRRDKDEPKVFGMEVSMTGGRVEQNKKDSTIRVFNLEPYVTYTVTLNPNSFDNISWKIRNPIISVTVDPNQFKLIEVPVAVVGEVAGMVYIKKNMAQMGQGRMILRFYRTDSVLMAKTVTEPDGYFNYLGLPPGSYFATIDAAQLHKLNMKVSPSSIPFIIKKSKDGDVADGLEFTLNSMIEDTLSKIQSEIKVSEPTHSEQVPKIKQESTISEEQHRKDSIKTGQTILPALKQEKAAEPKKSIIISEDNPKITPVSVSNISSDSFEYVIQVGSFHNESYAISAKNRLLKALNRSVDIDHEGEFFKVRVVSFKDIKEAKDFLPKIISEGFQQAFITKRIKR